VSEFRSANRAKPSAGASTIVACSASAGQEAAERTRKRILSVLPAVQAALPTVAELAAVRERIHLDLGHSPVWCFPPSWDSVEETVQMSVSKF